MSDEQIPSRPTPTEVLNMYCRLSGHDKQLFTLLFNTEEHFRAKQNRDHERLIIVSYKRVEDAVDRIKSRLRGSYAQSKINDDRNQLIDSFVKLGVTDWNKIWKLVSERGEHLLKTTRARKDKLKEKFLSPEGIRLYYMRWKRKQ
jgi:hypothetical protein